MPYSGALRIRILKFSIYSFAGGGPRPEASACDRGRAGAQARACMRGGEEGREVRCGEAERRRSEGGAEGSGGGKRKEESRRERRSLRG